MLYKPTSPTPYMIPIDPTKDLQFSSSCVNTISISKMRLMINDGAWENYYTFNAINKNSPLISGANLINNDIIFDIHPNEKYTNGYKISPKGVRRTDISTHICGNSDTALLKTNNTYSWQVRLYENDDRNIGKPINNIAYGFIQEVTDVTKWNDSKRSDLFDRDNTSTILKIRPHTNIFFNALKNSALDSGRFNSLVPSKFIAYYDDDVDYYIQINGVMYPVIAYYYCSNASNCTLETDSYGDPLFAYIEINTNGDSIGVDEQYMIYCNYIDSNEFYFPCKSAPEIKFYDQFDRELLFSENSTITTDCSNLIIRGQYKQAENSSVNYYQFSLYQVLKDKSELLIDSTGNIYSDNIQYSYDRLVSGAKYRLSINITDTDKNSFTKTAYVEPNYAETDTPICLKVKKHHKHGSLVIDFSKLISITGKETVPNAHEFLTINSGSGQFIKSSTELMGVTDKAQVCKIDKGNSIVFNKIDNTGDDLSFNKPIVSMIVRCNHGGKQHIFSLTDDNGYTYNLDWTGTAFKYSVKTHSVMTLGYALFSDKGFQVSNIERQAHSEVEKELSSSQTNYNVPYVAFSDIPYKSDYYWHTESVFEDFWWHVIVSDNRFYIRCLDPEHTDWTDDQKVSAPVYEEVIFWQA